MPLVSHYSANWISKMFYLTRTAYAWKFPTINIRKPWRAIVCKPLMCSWLVTKYLLKGVISSDRKFHQQTPVWQLSMLRVLLLRDNDSIKSTRRIIVVTVVTRVFFTSLVRYTLEKGFFNCTNEQTFGLFVRYFVQFEVCRSWGTRFITWQPCCVSI